MWTEVRTALTAQPTQPFFYVMCDEGESGLEDILSQADAMMAQVRPTIRAYLHSVYTLP